MLGILFQQTARYVKQYPEEVTPEEKEAIDGVIDYEKLAEKYNPQLTDPVKYTFRQDCTSQELAAYLNAWFGMLLRHPGTYISRSLIGRKRVCCRLRRRFCPKRYYKRFR